MSCCQDEIHLLGDFLKISLLSGHYCHKVANFFWNFGNFLKLGMFVMKCTKFTHVVGLAGKNISAISSIYRTRSGPMLIIFDQPLFQLITLLLCGGNLLF